MDTMCNKEEAEDLDKTITNFDDASADVKSVSRSESPVFKCVNHKVRGCRVDSSDYDIPSYQVNQSTKSKASSKFQNESSESLFPFSPIFSPFPVPSIPSQPASDVGKNCKQSELNDYKQKCSIFESLGMTDKDISWVSSMASPVPPAPETRLNTIEKATFLPEEKFQNIQPRALFSPAVDDDFGCKPLAFSSESEDDDAYKSNVRLSDVCATLKQLEVKSFDQTIENSQNSEKTSPVITTKKKKENERSRKKEKQNLNLLSVNETSVDSSKSASSRSSLQNFVEDDSFQSLSFSGIDELCKTLVNATESDISKRSFDLNRTVINNCSTTYSNIPKHFYSSKTKSDVYEVKELDNLHSYVRALEEVDLNIPPSKIDKSVVEKGIVTLDSLDRLSPKPNTKRLHSQLSVEKNESLGKKVKMDDSNWEEMKEYLSESQLNVNENEIFKTVENLERSLASQDAKESENIKQLESTEPVKDLHLVDSASDKIFQKSEFTTASGSKISVGQKALAKANRIFLDCDSENMVAPPVKTYKTIKISQDALEKAKTLMLGESSQSSSKTIRVSPEALEKAKIILDDNNKPNCKTTIKISPKVIEKAKELDFAEESYSKVIKVSPEALEKAKQIMLDPLKGFSTAKGKKINISNEALEKAKALMSACNENNEDMQENLSETEIFMLGSETNQEDTTNLIPEISTGNRKTVEVSDSGLEKSKSNFSENDGGNSKVQESLSETEKIFLFGNKTDQEDSFDSMQRFSSGSKKKVEVFDVDLKKTEDVMSRFSKNDGGDSKILETFTESEKNFMLGNEISQEDTFNLIREFSTCSGKEVMCNQSLEEPKAFKASLNDASLAEISSSSKCMPGFLTGTGKKIEVSATALEKAKALLASCEGESENIKVEKFSEMPVTFSTGTGKKIEVSKEALEKAKTLMESCDENSGGGRLGKKSERLQKFKKVTRTIPVSIEALEKAKAMMLDSSENSKEFFPVKIKKEEKEKSKVSMSGSGKSIESAESKNCKIIQKVVTGTGIAINTPGGLEKAKILSSCGSEETSSESQFCPTSSKRTQGFITGTGKKVEVSNEALEKAKVLMSKYDEDPNPAIISEDSRIVQGFTTGTGKKINVSKEALAKAKALLSECDDPKNQEPEKNIQVSKEAKEKAKALSNCKNVETESGKLTFTTGTGRKIQVSNEALEKAKALMSSCDECENSSGHLIPNFTTGTGKKVEVSADALKKVKGLMTCEENFGDGCLKSNKPQSFRNPLKVKKDASISEGNVKIINVSSDKVQTKQEEKIEESFKDDCWLDSFTQTESIEEKLKKQSNSLKESPSTDEIVPSWLHVYTTSPSLTSERQDSGDRRYVKSPVLGLGDRFYKKGKRKKLRFEEDRDKTSKTVKRTASNLDFSAPFKKVCYDIKKGREKARLEQERIAKEKHKVKPVRGSHLKRKVTEKQMSWSEAVKGCSPKVYSEEVLQSFGVIKDVREVTVDNAEGFKFNGCLFFGVSCQNNIEGIVVGDDCQLIPDDDNAFGIEEFKRAFLASPGVQPNLLPNGWLENHYRWIVWKLANYEKSFPHFFGGKCLTPNNVMLQLKYRYDREIDGNERSALKKVLERDDTSMKRMVLCVCGIKKVVTGEFMDYELTLTDGWYSCPAHSDPAMKKQIENGKVVVGTKLVTVGATLVNCDQGISPLELRGDVYLKISTNSTRRIRWDTKLGFQKNPGSITVSLGSILPQGGPISRLDVIVVRVYPLLYMEKTSDGHHITRNARSEEKAVVEYLKLQERRMESICNELQPDMQNANNELTKKLEQKLEKEKLNKRNVSEFLRVKIVDFRKPDYNNPALLSIWNPNEEVVGFFSEGKVLSLKGVTASSRTHKPLQLNTTRQTQFKQINRNVKYPARHLTRLADVSSKLCPVFEEIDLVGVIIRVQDVSYGSKLSQYIYLTDLANNFVGIVFWGNCKEYGWENILTVQSIVACSNLQWKKNNTAQEVPLLYVCENSVFTENPKQPYLKEELERLRKEVPQDKTNFFTKYDEELTFKLSEPKRPASRLSKIRNGFESRPTASSTPIKSFVGSLMTSDEAEPSPIQKRIEKLQNYGEPPPLMPLLVKNPMRKCKKS